VVATYSVIRLDDNVTGYLDAATAPIWHRGVAAFAARRAKELGTNAIIVLSHGTKYPGTVSSGLALRGLLLQITEPYYGSLLDPPPADARVAHKP
jgi:hypothetical protein